MQQVHIPPTTDAAAQQGVRSTLAQQRRLLLLKGLGKGSIAAAALIPLSSRATRSYVLDNPSLPGGNGYCSVSGFQSAAVSLAPGQTLTTCSALPPSSYYKKTESSYSWAAKNDADKNTANRRNAVRALFGSAGFGFTDTQVAAITDSQIDNFRTTSTLQMLGGSIFWATAFSDPATKNMTGSGTICRLEASTAYPGTVGVALPLRSFENMMSNAGAADATNPAETVLYTLFQTSPDNKAYFAAVALGCIKEDGIFASSTGFSAGQIPFDAKYVADLYNDSSKRAAAGVFFKHLCGA